ncbi:MAG: formimidoylglutamase [Luteibaculaceae bacterium]
MDALQFIGKTQFLPYITQRTGETKIGEELSVPENLTELKQLINKEQFQFAILGIPEDIGPRANGGKGGADKAFDYFLKAFTNMQSNRFLSGKKIVLLGQVHTQDLQEKANLVNPKSDDYLAQLRQLVEELDQRVYPIVEFLTEHQIVPILIGGGHNNAYPALKGAALGLHKAKKIDKPQLDCLNFDAHADFRPQEGRHSGNGFTYAFKEKYLWRYSIIGLHESYNSENMLQKMDEYPHRIQYTFFDQIISGIVGLERNINDSLIFLSAEPIALELDLDAIRNVASSAQSPSGFDVIHARKFIKHVAFNRKIAYLHLTEGAPELNKNDSMAVGKLLAYLVSDFIKAQRSRKRN